MVTALIHAGDCATKEFRSRIQELQKVVNEKRGWLNRIQMYDARQIDCADALNRARRNAQQMEMWLEFAIRCSEDLGKEIHAICRAQDKADSDEHEKRLAIAKRDYDYTRRKEREAKKAEQEQ